ncbi:MAG: hypothetical protein ACR2P0_05615 [Acidimicrobiales bacterium]
MVVAAPREVHDYVYRACRVSGASHGEANEIAAAATTAEIQLSGAVERVVELLEAGSRPAIGRLALAGAATSSNLAVADLADVIAGEARSGSAPGLFCGDDVHHDFDDWFRVGSASLAIRTIDEHWKPITAERLAAIEARSAQAHQRGVSVADRVWARLALLAKGYLIPEADLDAADDVAVVD